MSISGALANALSGLNAQSRSSEVVSANISNALTDGYGRREIHLSPRWVGGSGAGVQVSGISREVDGFVIGERWLAEAGLARDEALAGFYLGLQDALGGVDDPHSLTSLLSSLDTSLTEAASRPDSSTRLDVVAANARLVAAKFNQISDRLQELRGNADAEIARQVGLLNSGLEQVHRLNLSIRANANAGRDVNAYLDQRQRAIDELAGIVPLRIAQREGGQVALYTSGGALLLDGSPAPLSFSGVGLITPDMTVNSGALAEVTISGRPSSATSRGPLAGGSLEAAFRIRDEVAVGAQADLDALARNLADRLADPSVDPTIPGGDPGLFTDAGFAVLSGNEVGLSARISVNPIVDPDQGGASWRLRDGIGAASPGPVGNASLLNALRNALTAPATLTTGSMAGSSGSANALAGDYMSSVMSSLAQSERAQAFSQATRDSLKDLQLRDGVDTDQEMQKLLLIEQAYAANARVFGTADQMLQTLLEL